MRDKTGNGFKAQLRRRIELRRLEREYQQASPRLREDLYGALERADVS